MLHWIFGGMMGLALLWGMAAGNGGQVAAQMLKAAEEAVGTALALAGAYAFFCGMLNIARRAGAAEGLGNLLSPMLKRLFGSSLPQEALEPVTVNLTANLLGLGNAATPMGMEAARRMGRGEDRASDALCLFLVVNASSVQLFPATVIALRAAAGSADPGSVALPAFAATAISTAVGILCCKCAEKWGEAAR
ncbi:MAG: spore maturation protein [Clostridia bacterium]|nr:spore maturation protein [Clostridia bacterium]